MIKVSKMHPTLPRSIWVLWRHWLDWKDSW